MSEPPVVDQRWVRALGGPMSGAWWPLAVLVAAYAAVVIAAGPRLDDPLYAGWLAGAKVPALVAGGQWWRVVTASFIHLSPLHLAGNLAGAWYLGRIVCGLYGPARVWLAFFATAVAGTIGSQLLVDRWSLGASGGVFGLLGVALGFAVLHGSQVPRRLRSRLAWRVAPWALAFLALCAGLSAGHIDHVAHVTALSVGFVLGLVQRPVVLGAPARTRLTTAGVAATVVVAAWALTSVLRHGLAEPAGRREITDAARDLVYTVPETWIEAPAFDRHTCAATYTDGLVHVCVGGRPHQPDRGALLDALRLDARAAGFGRLEPGAPALAPDWTALGTLVGDGPNRGGQRIAIYVRPGPRGDRAVLVHTLTTSVEAGRLRRDVGPILASVRPGS